MWSTIKQEYSFEPTPDEQMTKLSLVFLGNAFDHFPGISTKASRS